MAPTPPGSQEPTAAKQPKLLEPQPLSISWYVTFHLPADWQAMWNHAAMPQVPASSTAAPGDEEIISPPPPAALFFSLAQVHLLPARCWQQHLRKESLRQKVLRLQVSQRHSLSPASPMVSHTGRGAHRRGHRHHRLQSSIRRRNRGLSGRDEGATQAQRGAARRNERAVRRNTRNTRARGRNAHTEISWSLLKFVRRF